MARLRTAPEGDPLDAVERELGRLAAELATSSGGALQPVAQVVGAYLRRPGKRVRARLCLAGEALVSSRAPTSAAITTAAVLETVHAFLLIHDDLMDRADVRRGLPALHVALRPPTGPARERSGGDLALVAGDWLYTVALRALLRAPGVHATMRLRVLDLLLEIFAQTAQGQVLDALHGQASTAHVSLDGVLETYRLKTARYTFEAPLLAGALLGGASEAVVERLRAFSDAAGVAFQLVDDLLGLFASDDHLGKPAVSDLAEGKKTWPVMRALALAPVADRAWLAGLLERQDAGPADLERARSIVTSTGALRESLACAGELLRTARAELEGLPGGAPRRELQRIVESLEDTARALAPVEPVVPAGATPSAEE